MLASALSPSNSSDSDDRQSTCPSRRALSAACPPRPRPAPRPSGGPDRVDVLELIFVQVREQKLVVHPPAAPAPPSRHPPSRCAARVQPGMERAETLTAARGHGGGGAEGACRWCRRDPGRPGEYLRARRVSARGVGGARRSWAPAPALRRQGGAPAAERVALVVGRCPRALHRGRDLAATAAGAGSGSSGRGGPAQGGPSLHGQNLSVVPTHRSGEIRASARCAPPWLKSMRTGSGAPRISSPSGGMMYTGDG